MWLNCKVCSQKSGDSLRYSHLSARFKRTNKEATETRGLLRLGNQINCVCVRIVNNSLSFVLSGFSGKELEYKPKKSMYLLGTDYDIRVKIYINTIIGIC